jgi:hypothetical protein
MLVKGQSDFSYRSAAQFNLLVVAPEDAPFLAKVQEVRQENPKYEIVAVTRLEDALKLLRRGTIATVLVDGHPRTPGTAELLIEGLSKERAPRFIVFFDDAPGGLPADPSPVRVVRSGIEGTQLARLLEQCCQEFDSMPRNTLTPLDLLEALTHSPDSAWIRVTHESGESGDFCIREGRAVYCEVGRMTGATAAARLLGWTPCRFEYRDYPSFLMPNLDRGLSDLRSLRLRNAAQPQGVNRISSIETRSAQPAAATGPAPPAAPVPAEAAIEEPIDFPVLEGFSWEAPAGAANGKSASVLPAADGLDNPMDEPDEFPAFSAEDEADLGVEEPVDLLALPEMGGAGGGDPLRIATGSVNLGEPMLEEPASLPDFEAAPGSEPGHTSSCFAAVAVVSFDHLLSCTPADEAGFFAARSLLEVYEHVTRYSRMQGLGDQDFIVISGMKATLAIAPIPGSENLLAVRLKGKNLGDPERYELHRLQEAMQLTYATVSA